MPRHIFHVSFRTSYSRTKTFSLAVIPVRPPVYSRQVMLNGLHKVRWGGGQRTHQYTFKMLPRDTGRARLKTCVDIGTKGLRAVSRPTNVRWVDPLHDHLKFTNTCQRHTERTATCKRKEILSISRMTMRCNFHAHLSYEASVRADLGL